MFKTIFGKQFALNILTILITFSIMGMVLSGVFRSYFMDTQITRLTEQSEKLSSLITEKTFLGVTRLDNQVLNNIFDEITVITKYTDTTFMFIDYNFNVLLSNAEDKSIYEGLVLEEDSSINKIFNGEIVVLEGTLGGVFDRDKLTVGYPVSNGYNIIGAVMLSTPMDTLKETVSEGMKLPIYCMLISAGVAFVLTYFFSKSISSPVRQMNEAAKVIASGDFEKRIEVYTEDEVGQLAESFNNMAKSLEEQEISRREFIGNISHDLRSPLTSIIGFLKAMKDGTIGEEKKDYYLNIVLDECIRLSKLANDILDMSNIQSVGTVDIKPEIFDINELIRRTAIQFENRITKKNINLSVLFADERNEVNADYEKIQRVIYNIMDNAVKFTPYEGFIKVETTIKEEKVYISVKDSGKGLTLEEQQRIFDRFYKADASRGYDKKGSGLGLSIAKEFLKAHNEKIFVNSGEGQGCEFIFTLTLADAKEVKEKNKEKNTK